MKKSRGPGAREEPGARACEEVAGTEWNIK